MKNQAVSDAINKFDGVQQAFVPKVQGPPSRGRDNMLLTRKV